MNEKINADLKSIKFIFDRNKFYILPCLIIFACIILFFQFVIPQLKSLIAAREQVKKASLTLAVLKENLNVLVNTNENSLDAQLKILNLALPLDKDFTGILSSIYYTSQETGVSLGAFSLRIGDLGKEEKNDKFSTITLSVPVNSDVAGVISFVEKISKTVPLSEVTLIKIGEITSTINLSFYYKPLGIAGIKEDIRINPLPQKGLELISILESFGNSSSFTEQMPVATSSSETNANPF